MTAGKYNFTIEQNSKFIKVLTYTDSTGALVPLTGYTAFLTIRSVATGTPLVIDLSTTPDSSGNGITLGGSAGTITILIHGVTTAAMNFTEAKYTLRLVDPSGEPDRLIEGAVSFSPETAP